jgi:hypothetical protein
LTLRQRILKKCIGFAIDVFKTLCYSANFCAKLNQLIADNPLCGQMNGGNEGAVDECCSQKASKDRSHFWEYDPKDHTNHRARNPTGDLKNSIHSNTPTKGSLKNWLSPAGWRTTTGGL